MICVVLQHGCKCFNEDFFDYHAFIHTYIHTYTIIFLYRYIHIALTKWFIYVHTNTREGRWWLPPQPPADWRLTVGQQTGTYLAAITTTTRQITRKRRMSQKSNRDRQTTDKTTCWVVDLLRSTHCDRSSPRIEWEKRTRVREYIASLTMVQTACLSLLVNEWNASNIPKCGSGISVIPICRKLWPTVCSAWVCGYVQQILPPAVSAICPSVSISIWIVMLCLCGVSSSSSSSS